MSHSGGGDGSDDDTSSLEEEDVEDALNALVVGVKRLDPTYAARFAAQRVSKQAISGLFGAAKTVTGSAETAAKGVHRKASQVTDKIKRRVSSTSKGGSIISALSAHLSGGDSQSIEEKMLQLQLEIIDQVLDDAVRQEKTQWLKTTVYDDNSDEKLSYKQQAEFLLEALKLLGIPKDVLEPEFVEKIEGLDRKAIIKYAEHFIKDYKANIGSAVKDGDLVGKFSTTYAEISTTIFCSLIMLVYNMLLMSNSAAAHTFATAMVSLAEGSAPTRTIAKQLLSIEAASKTYGKPAAAALALAGGAMIINGSATPTAIIAALALASPAPGLIDKDEVRAYIINNIKLEVSTVNIAGIKVYNAIERLQRVTRGIRTTTSTAPHKKKG